MLSLLKFLMNSCYINTIKVSATQAGPLHTKYCCKGQVLIYSGFKYQKKIREQLRAILMMFEDKMQIQRRDKCFHAL